ncbi:MAG: MotA/TolQ/ExbB proton channel family protein [Synergistaceae bacterium]|nr:MotA/TolQ/ExbB proton channel family protein [Synergistaceae bacterium]
MFTVIQQGGFIMWIIFSLSILSLAVIIERLIFFTSSKCNTGNLIENFGKEIFANNREKAWTIIKERDTCYHRIFCVALAHWEITTEQMRLLMHSVVREEIFKFQKHINVLDIIAKIAPLLGLLGTVLGMVKMFQSLNLTGAINASAVTGGIYEALFTTVAGLIVAIPVVSVTGLLNSHIDSVEEKMQQIADYIVREHLSINSNGK